MLIAVTTVRQMQVPYFFGLFTLFFRTIIEISRLIDFDQSVLIGRSDAFQTTVHPELIEDLMYVMRAVLILFLNQTIPKPLIVTIEQLHAMLGFVHRDDLTYLPINQSRIGRLSHWFSDHNPNLGPTIRHLSFLNDIEAVTLIKSKVSIIR